MIATTPIPLTVLLISLLTLSPLSAVKQNGKTENKPKVTFQPPNNIDLFSKVYMRNLQFASSITSPMYMRMLQVQKQKMNPDQNNILDSQKFLETQKNNKETVKNTSSAQKLTGMVNPYYAQAMLTTPQHSWNPDKMSKSNFLDNRDMSIISGLKRGNRIGKRHHTIELHKKHNQEHYEIANLAKHSLNQKTKEHANAKLTEMKENHTQMKTDLKEHLHKISGKSHQEISQEVEDLKKSKDQIIIAKQEKPTITRKDSKKLTDEEYNSFLDDIKERAGARLGQRDFYKVYSQVAHEHGLNFDEYLLKFGDAHFNSFMDHEPEFTDKGQDFVQNVGKGLQNALMDTSKLTKEILEDPQAFKIFAFDSHVDIYVDNGLQDILLESPIQNTRALLHCYLWPVIMTEKVNSGRNALEVVEKIVKNDIKAAETKIIDSIEGLIVRLEADRIMEGAIREKYERLGLDYDLIFKNIKNPGPDQEEQINRLKQHIAQEDLLQGRIYNIRDNKSPTNPSQRYTPKTNFVFDSTLSRLPMPNPVFVKQIMDNMKTQDTREMMRQVMIVENQFVYVHKKKEKDKEEFDISITKGPRKKSILLNESQILSRENELDKEINPILIKQENQSYIQKMTGKFMENLRYYQNYKRSEPVRHNKSISSTSHISQNDQFDKSYNSKDGSKMNSPVTHFGNQVPDSKSRHLFWTSHMINQNGDLEQIDYLNNNSSRHQDYSPISRNDNKSFNQSSHRSESQADKSYISISTKQSQSPGRNNRGSMVSVRTVDDTIIEKDNESDRENMSSDHSPSKAMNNFYRVLI